MDFCSPPPTPTMDFVARPESKAIANNITVLWKNEYTNDNEFITFVDTILTVSSKIISLPLLYTTMYYVHTVTEKLKGMNRPCDSEFSLFLGCLMLADISVNDTNYQSSTWSKISGVHQEDIVRMKLELLTILDYNINLSHTNYHKWVESFDQATIL